jgi:hypothetical protein
MRARFCLTIKQPFVCLFVCLRSMPDASLPNVVHFCHRGAEPLLAHSTGQRSSAANANAKAEAQRLMRR